MGLLVEGLQHEAIGARRRTGRAQEDAGSRRRRTLDRRQERRCCRCIEYANDLSGWLAHAPHDPLRQVVAGFHVYHFAWPCSSRACWASAVAPVAEQVPVLTGELRRTTVRTASSTTSWGGPTRRESRTLAGHGTSGTAVAVRRHHRLRRHTDRPGGRIQVTPRRGAPDDEGVMSLRGLRPV